LVWHLHDMVEVSGDCRMVAASVAKITGAGY
jgi:hypothetical protein